MNTSVPVPIDWKRRAWKAEARLRHFGHQTPPQPDPDEYLVLVGEHMDGRPVKPGEMEEATAKSSGALSASGFQPRCSICGLYQRETPAGLTCHNGHGGAASI